MKFRIFVIISVIFLGNVLFTGCSIANVSPALQTESATNPVPSFNAPTLDIQTQVASITPTPDGWDKTLIVDAKYFFSSTNNSDGYNGRAIDTSGTLVNFDTRWDISIKVEPLKDGATLESTGIVIAGKRPNNTESSIFLGYSGKNWAVGYAPFSPANYTFMQSLNSITGLEETFQISISSNGKLLELINDSQVVFRQEFPDPIFPSTVYVTTYTQNGPHSSITISRLMLEKKTGKDSVAYTIQPTSTSFQSFGEIQSISDPDFENNFLSIAYSPDGHTLISNNRDSLIIWEDH